MTSSYEFSAYIYKWNCIASSYGLVLGLERDLNRHAIVLVFRQINGDFRYSIRIDEAVFSRNPDDIIGFHVKVAVDSIGKHEHGRPNYKSNSSPNSSPKSDHAKKNKKIYFKIPNYGLF